MKERLDNFINIRKLGSKLILSSFTSSLNLFLCLFMRVLAASYHVRLKPTLKAQVQRGDDDKFCKYLQTWLRNRLVKVMIAVQWIFDSD